MNIVPITVPMINMANTPLDSGELKPYLSTTTARSLLTDGNFEIWLRIEGEAFAYYLFPYDQAVIDCE